MSQRKFKPDVISIAIALITFAVSGVAWRGGFTGGYSHCGDTGLGCIAIAVMILVAGILIGQVAALIGLIQMRGRSWPGWIGMFLNCLPILVVGAWLLYGEMAQ